MKLLLGAANIWVECEHPKHEGDRTFMFSRGYVDFHAKIGTGYYCRACVEAHGLRPFIEKPDAR